MLFARAKVERLASAVRDNKIVSLTVLSLVCSTSNILNKLVI
jgi:hypothetical protein